MVGVTTLPGHQVALQPQGRQLPRERPESKYLSHETSKTLFYFLLEAEKAKAEADKAKAEKALHGHLLQGLAVLTVERQLLDLLPGSAFFRVGTH